MDVTYLHAAFCGWSWLSAGSFTCAQTALEPVTRIPANTGRCSGRAGLTAKLGVTPRGADPTGLRTGSGSAGPPVSEGLSMDIRPDDIVVIRAVEDEWPEHLFRVTDVWEDCVGGISLNGPLKDEYGEPEYALILRVHSRVKR